MLGGQTLYGMTQKGGTDDYGTIYKIADDEYLVVVNAGMGGVIAEILVSVPATSIAGGTAWSWYGMLRIAIANQVLFVDEEATRVGPVPVHEIHLAARLLA